MPAPNAALFYGPDNFLTNTIIKVLKTKKPQQLRNSNTKSPKQSCRTYFFASFIVEVQGKVLRRVQRTKMKTVIFLEYFSFNSSDELVSPHFCG